MNQADLRRYAADPLAFIEDLQISTREGPARCGNVMQAYQRERLELLAPDLLALARGKKPPCGRHFWETSKGSSKTSDTAAALLWLLIFANRPLSTVSGAVDRTNAQELQKACRSIIAENPKLTDAVEVQQWAIVGKQSGAICEIESADQKGSSGARPMFCHIDEAGHVPDDRWPYVENWLDNAAKISGIVLITTNPGWVDTRAFKLRELARQSRRWKFHQLAEPSPLMAPEEIEEAKERNSPARFARLYGGQWGPKGEGDAIPLDDVRACTVLRGQSEFRSDRYCFVGGALDIGLKRDRSGFVLLGLCANDPEFHIELITHRSWRPSPGQDVQIADVQFTVANLAHHHGSKEIYYDSWQAESIAPNLDRMGFNMLPFTNSPLVLSEMARQTVTAFKDRIVRIYDCPELLKDLAAMSIEDTLRGYKLVAPRTSEGHSDLGFAFCMGLSRMAIVRQWCLQSDFISRQYASRAEQEAQWIRTANGAYGVPLDSGYYAQTGGWDLQTAKRIELPSRGGR